MNIHLVPLLTLLFSSSMGKGDLFKGLLSFILILRTIVVLTQNYSVLLSDIKSLNFTRGLNTTSRRQLAGPQVFAHSLLF